MTNHVHLIINPGKDVKTLSELIKRVNGRQTRYVNKIELNPARRAWSLVLKLIPGQVIRPAAKSLSTKLKKN
jgi:REP element-mobilizing transposase RayT